MYQHILIATDGSELSEKAVESGLALARLSGAKVTTLKVVPRYPRSYFDGGVVVEPAEIQRVEQQWSDAAQDLLNKVKERGRESGVTVETVVAHSDLIAESVISTARERECDLIVMASHGRNGLKRLLLGSETQHVLTHSHTPVLVLR